MVRWTMQARALLGAVLCGVQIVAGVPHGEDDGHVDERHHGSGHHIVNTVLVITVVAGICGVVTSWLFTQTELCSGVPLPYTLAIFLLGAACSATTDIQDEEDVNKESLRYIWIHAFNQAQHMNPHIIILAILPPLIYESASDMNYHVFKKVMRQAILLAFPGMIMSLLLTGYWCEFTFGHGWSLSVAMLLGAIVSATDPVAVVAALHELGAPAKLASIIDGESLLNDGSAMVMFLIFLHLSSGEEDYDFGGGILLFLKLAGGGVAWGLVAYMISSMVIHQTTDTWKIEVTTIVMSVYFTFGMAEIILGVSGIIAVVVFGIMMSRRGKYAISPSVEEKLHATMGSLAHVSETAIFFVAGIVAYDAITSDGIGAKEYANLFGLYAMLHVIRGFVILVCWPVMNKIGDAGYRLTWKECFIMTWGGLRGAVGLALGLLVMESAKGENLTNENAKLVNFYVSGVVILTMAINGTTCVTIYQNLGIYPTNAFRQKMVTNVVNDIEEEMQQYLVSDSFKGDWLYCETDIRVLRQLCPVFRDVRVNEQNELTNLPTLPKIHRIIADMEFAKPPLPHSMNVPVEELVAEQKEDGEMRLEERNTMSWLGCYYEEITSPDALPRDDSDASEQLLSLAGDAEDGTKEALAPAEAFKSLDQVGEIATTIFAHLKQCYMAQYEAKELDDEGIYFVMEALESGSDFMNQDHSGREKASVIEAALQSEFFRLRHVLPIPVDKFGRMVVKHQTSFIIGYYARNDVFHRMLTTFESLSGFIRAHEMLIEQVKKDGRLKNTKVLQSPIDMAKREYRHWASQFPGVAKTHRVLVSTRRLVFEKQKKIQEAFESGLLIEGDVVNMQENLKRLMAKLQALRFDPWVANNKGRFWGTSLKAPGNRNPPLGCPKRLHHDGALVAALSD